MSRLMAVPLAKILIFALCLNFGLCQEIPVVAVEAQPNCDGNDAEDTDKLFEEYFEWKKTEFPGQTYFYGLDNLGTKLSTNSKMERENMLKNAKKYRQKAQEYLEFKLNNLKRELYLKRIVFETQLFIDNYGLNGQLLPPIGFMGGIQTELPYTFSSENAYKWETDEDFRINLERLKHVPKQLDVILEQLKEGVEQGITHANESLVRAKSQFESLQGDNF